MEKALYLRDLKAQHSQGIGLSYSQAIKFHGHNGPFLALGFRIGKEIKRFLKPEGITDLLAIVGIEKRKPFTCIIDGLQCSLGTTMGKGNIILRKGKGWVKVKNRKTGKVVKFKIKKEVITRCLNSQDLSQDADEILKEKGENLWFSSWSK
ncbi:MAG: formylmethanofuran dehydrogenase subunit E family protein [candidate division WOR-3 bacterium]